MSMATGILLALLILSTANRAIGDTDACGNQLLYTSRTTEEDYILQSLLLKGFRMNKVNTYTIQKGGFTLDVSKRQCIAVHYNIECGENTTAVCNMSKCDSKEGDQVLDMYTLWTTFNGSSTTGNGLLKLTVHDLRVFGFELCDVYIEPIHINITMESPEPISQSCYDYQDSLN